MLNSKGERELAYLVKIDDITPINGYDRVELAHVGGWTVVVGKNEFKAGDTAVYFEIDSKLPEKPPFSDMDFLVKKHYKIQTQKMCKSISQGLLMAVNQFPGWEVQVDGTVLDNNSGDHGLHTFFGDSRFLTKDLEVTYAVAEDNRRKANSLDKYKKMAQRHPALFKKKFVKWLMKRNWGKKFLFFFFGKKKDKKTGWPVWVEKTDEERIENMPYIFNSNELWIATEKIDGSSTTFSLKRNRSLFGPKYDFYICSRNVVFDKPNKKCFYDINIYTEMAEKYNIEKKLIKILNNHPEWEWITIQGETYGAKVQKRDYGMINRDFKVFNLVTSDIGRWNSNKMKQFLDFYRIPCVPILQSFYKLPASIKELRKFVNSNPSQIDGDIREGVVFRSQDGKKSFKCVSPEFLLKYHG